MEEHEGSCKSSLMIDFWMENDPKCPGCGKFHDRERVGNTATFIVKDVCNWHKPKGRAIPNDTPYRSRSKK
jgi:hypothetical protein